MLIKIYKWHCNYMDKYPRMFSEFHQNINSFIFNLMVKKYNPKIQLYKDIHPDPRASKCTHVTKYIFNDTAICFGSGGHKYALGRGFITNKDHIPFGDGIVV